MYAETKKREIKALLKALKKLNAEELLILTLNSEEIIDNWIKFISILKWLLVK